MGSAFHQLCPRYSGTLTPTAPTAIRLWDTFTFLSNYVANTSIVHGKKGRKTDMLKTIKPLYFVGGIKKVCGTFS